MTIQSGCKTYLYYYDLYRFRLNLEAFEHLYTYNIFSMRRRRVLRVLLVRI
jgi:hypothetical protein